MVTKAHLLLNPALITATIFLFVILTTSQGNIGIAQAQKKQDQISVYSDQEGRFTVEYPSDWYVNEEPSDDKNTVVQFDSSEPESGTSNNGLVCSGADCDVNSF